MMYIENYQDIIKIVRQYIHEVIGVNLKDIKNSTSTYGETLIKLLEGKKYNSYKLNDSVVLLDLETRNNDSDVVMTEGEYMVYNKSYDLKIITYGESSMQIGNSIYSKFNTDYVLSNLLAQGIYIEEITHPVLFNEFVNDVIWPRTDLSLLISVKHRFKTSLGYEYNTINGVEPIDF